MQIWPLDSIVYLALDTSDLKNGYILIRLALIYRGRAIPVSWRVIKHNSTSVGYKDYKVVLKQALCILPPGLSIILLADRGFVHQELIKFCRQHHWGYRLRAKSTTRIRLPDRSVTSFGGFFVERITIRSFLEFHGGCTERFVFQQQICYLIVDGR